MKTIKTWLSLAVLFGSVVTMLAQDNDIKSTAGQKVEPTTYQIRNKKYQELLRPKDANGADGTHIVLYSPEPWKCMTWKVQSATNDGYCLRNLFTSKTFTPGKGEAARVTQIPFSKELEKVPTWQFTKLEDGTYKITEAGTAQVLTAVPETEGYGEKIVTQPWQNLDEQKWELLKIDPKDLTM